MVRVLPTNIPPFRRLPTMQKKLCRLPFLNEAAASSTLFQLFFLSGATQDPEDIARILQQHVQTQTYFLLLLIPNRSGGREREKNPPKKNHPRATKNERIAFGKLCGRMSALFFCDESSASEYGFNNATASVYFSPLPSEARAAVC